MLVQGISTQPGFVTQGLAASETDGVNLDIDEPFPVDCGQETSQQTGITARYLAASQAYCDPDAAQLPGRVLNVSELPTGLFGIAPSVTDSAARFLFQCGVSVPVLSWITADAAGDAQPFWNLYYQSQPLLSGYFSGMTIAPLVSNFPVFNSGKNPQGLIFAVNTTYWLSGMVSVSGPSSLGSVGVILWISPLNTTYGTPAPQLPVGSFSVIPNTGDYAYQVSFMIPNDTVTYQIVGLNFSNVAAVQTSVFLGNPIISTAHSVAQCRSLQAKMPKYGFNSSILSLAPNNLCVLTQADQQTCGSCALGSAFCDANAVGAACDAPAIATTAGKFAFAGMGTDGLVVDPTGVVQRASSSPDTVGMCATRSLRMETPGERLTRPQGTSTRTSTV